MESKDFNRLKFNKSIKRNRHRGQKLKNKIYRRSMWSRYRRAYKDSGKKKFCGKKFSYNVNNTDPNDEYFSVAF